MPAMEIKAFTLAASLGRDEGSIQFQFVDGTTLPPLNVPAVRYAAIVATLQATPKAYYNVDTATGIYFVSSVPDIPGHGLVG
jgi:hypothetical protein